MIDSLRPYKKTKPSGLRWLGDIPSHWALYRGKSQFRRVSQPVLPADETVTCFRDGTVTLRRNRRLTGFTEALKEIGYQGIEPGDLVIHAMDAFAGAIGVSDSRGKASPVYSVCKPTGECSPEYTALTLRLMAQSRWIEALSTGIRERSTDFRYTTFGNQWLPVPPTLEQRAIVTFLTHTSHRVNQAIDAKRKTIALLNEQKQAIVHQAVTRGLDPSVPLKPSGLPWLGDIPTDWEVLRAKSVFDAIDERSATGAEELLTVSSAKGIVPRSSSNVTMFKAKSYVGHKLCSPGDLVVNSLWAWAGGLGLSSHRGIISTAYSVYRPKPEFAGYAEYLHELLRSQAYKWEFTVRSKGIWVSRLQLSDESFMAMPLLLPPREEVVEITQQLRSSLKDIDASIETLERQIELLVEYRTRLTSDVVTGKLDVREAAKSLPDLNEGTYAALDFPTGDLDNELEAAGAA